MFCRKCGKQIPDDSDFCPKCGTRNAIDIELEDVDDDDDNDYIVPNHQTGSNPIVKNSELYCPKCRNRIFAEWDRCANCGTLNPYNPNAKSNQTNVFVPPPQVIVKEERIIIKEDKKPEKKGCGTWLAECIGGFLVICFLLGMLQSCFSCVG